MAAAASQGPQPASARPVAGLAFSVAVAASALAAGVGLVGAGLAWEPSHGNAQALSRGAQVYAAECASCHGTRLEGGAAPPLGATGHAWRHSDAELAGIVVRGTAGAGLPGVQAGMPAFAERLDRGEIDAVLAYVRSRWPANVHAYQATLNPGGAPAPSALLRDPAWTFPAQCLSPPATADGF